MSDNLAVSHCLHGHLLLSLEYHFNGNDIGLDVLFNVAQDAVPLIVLLLQVARASQ